MKRSFRAIGLCWLLLIALVFLYTDREAYTWAYAGEEIEKILISETQAAAQEQAAQQAQAQEKQEARERHAAGLWGKDDMYGGAPETRPAQESGVQGLNLMPGTYEVTVAYVSASDFALRAVSAGRQAFLVGEAARLAADGGEVSFAFTVTDATESVCLAGDIPEDAQVTGVTVRRSMNRVFSADLAAFAALAGGVLTLLILLWSDERPVGRRRRRDALLLIGAALFASLPVLMDGLFDGHDLFFHLNRVEGIACAMRCGQFPVRIHASTLLGYGYAAPAFYPELFLYIPALLVNLGVSLTASVQVFEILINLATAFVCYVSARRIFASREIAVASAGLYTLSIYRLIDLYTRAAWGETLAMIFYPLLIAALIDVLMRDEREWPSLALAMICIFASHLLSTLFAGGLCVLTAVLCLPQIVRRPRRILACIKAAAMTVLCSLWFVVPFLQYTAEGISTNVAMETYLYVQPLGAMLFPFSNATGGSVKLGRAFSEAAGTQPGLALLVGCGLLLAGCYAQGRTRSADETRLESQNRRLPLVMLAVGMLALLGSTSFLPWERLCSLPSPYSTFVQQIQFPWRLLSVATPLLCFAAACGYLSDPRWRRAGAALALGLSLVFSGALLGEFAQQEAILGPEDYLDSRIGQFEYTYIGTEKSALAPGDVSLPGADFRIESYEKRGTSLSMVLTGTDGAGYLEAPLLYYPGYQATVNGQRCTVTRGENSVVRVYGSFGQSTCAVEIWFEEPLAWRAAEIASLLGAALLIVLLIRRRRAA